MNALIRNYRAMAEAQNRAAWAMQPQSNDADFRATWGDAADTITARMEEAAHASQARYLLGHANQMRRIIDELADCPDLFWSHRFFRDLPLLPVLSADEAARECAKALRREKMQRGTRFYDPASVERLTNGLTIARYFRRFGRRVWQEAAQ